jgi:hypothetical protein
MIRRFITLWDHREPATAIAAVRIAVGLTLLADLLHAAALGLPSILWRAPSSGGIAYNAASPAAWASSLLHLDGTILHAIACLAAASFAAGALTRTSGAVLLLTSAQLAHLLPEADRGIDQLLRAALVILILSPCGTTLSVDARLRHGRWSRPDALEPGWARRLLVVQLAWVYLSAAMHKLQSAWLPGGDFVALYRILHDPHVARPAASAFAAAAPWLTQLATAVTVVFEWSAPLVLYLGARGWPRLRMVWILTGLAFHLGLAASMRLGIFPWGMLALYPALLSPPDWAALTDRLRAAYVSILRRRSTAA